MNLQEHLAGIIADKVGSNTPMQPLSRTIVKDAQARSEISELAKKFNLEVSIETPEETLEYTPSGLIPVSVMDISGSMVTPENKAMLATVSIGLEERTLQAPSYIACHTRAYLWDLDTLMSNIQTGGTVLSKAFNCLKDNRHDILDATEAVVLYYLTDGDNWTDDNQKFAQDLADLYDSGVINKAVIHISNHRIGCSTAFRTAVEYVAMTRKGIKVVATSDSMGDLIGSAETVLKAFDELI